MKFKMDMILIDERDILWLNKCQVVISHKYFNFNKLLSNTFVINVPIIIMFFLMCFMFFRTYFFLTIYTVFVKNIYLNKYYEIVLIKFNSLFSHFANTFLKTFLKRKDKYTKTKFILKNTNSNFYICLQNITKYKFLIVENIFKRVTINPNSTKTKTKNKKRSYSISNYYNHFKHLAEQYFDTGYMISTKSNKNTIHLFKFIAKHQIKIKAYFKHINITMDKSLRWITLRMPQHRYQPIKSYIKSNFPKNIKLRFKQIPFLHRDLQKDTIIRLQMFNNNPLVIVELNKFLHNNNYIRNELMISQSIKNKNYHAKWDLPDNIKPETVIHHWYASSHRYSTNIHKTDKIHWIANTKNNAIMALNQIFKHSINLHKTNDDSLRKYKKYLVNKIIKYHMNDKKYTDDDLESLVLKYPFLQMYDPNIKPIISTKITIKNMKIGFLNINGNAKYKINLIHPYMQQLIIQHRLDIIILIDTRKSNKPEWKLPGYKLAAHKSPIQNNNDCKIGGILVYYKSNLKTKIELIQKTVGFNTIWLSLKNTKTNNITYLAANYVRPFDLDNYERSTVFFDTLEKDIMKFKNKCHNIIVVGDFNARLGEVTNDFNKETYKPMYNDHSFPMTCLLQTTGLIIANPAHAPGILTCLSKDTQHKGGSIIDFVMTNKLNNIETLKIDTNPVFQDHRPVIFTLRNIKCSVTSCDKHFIFRHFKPNDTDLKTHETIIKNRIPEINKFAKNIKDYISLNDRIFISNIVTTCVWYTIHLATIQGFGIIDTQSMNRWYKTSVDQLELIAQQSNLNNTQNNYEIGKQILDKAKKLFAR